MPRKRRIPATIDVVTKEYNATEEKNSNTIGRKIAEARRKKGFSIATFSEYLANYGIQVSTRAEGKWETGDSIPNAYQFMAVCAALDLEDKLRYFMPGYTSELNEEGERKVAEYRADLISSGKYRPTPKLASIITYKKMPVSDLRVSAGTGAFLDEGSFEEIDFPADKVPTGADFGVRISGDSMEPAYHDGQIVWVHKCDTVPVGDVGVFIYDGEGYIKLFYEQEPENPEEFTDSYGEVRAQPVLVSYNPAYPPRIVLPNTRFQVVGKVL